MISFLSFQVSCKGTWGTRKLCFISITLDISGNQIEAHIKLPPFYKRQFKCNFLDETFWISNYISLKCSFWSVWYYYFSIASDIDWCRTSDKPKSDPIMTYFTDAYMRQHASPSLNESKLWCISENSWCAAVTLTKCLEKTHRRYPRIEAQGLYLKTIFYMLP